MDFAPVVEFVDRWQTLIAGSLALLGAWLTVRAIRRQIDQTEEHRRDERRRRLEAALTLLPSILSDILRISQKNIKILRSHLRDEDANEPDLHIIAQSVSPFQGHDVLRECIQYADEAALSRLQELARTIASFNNGVRTDSDTSKNTYGWLPYVIVENALIVAQVEQLFPWAWRKEQAPTKLRAEDVTAVLKRRPGELRSQHLARLTEHIERQLEHL